MMNNLFSSFDPSSNWSTSLNWTSIFIGLTIMPLTFWLIPSRMLMLFILLDNYIISELKNIIKNNKSSSIIFMAILTMIMFNNFMGLFPYIFTSTSHMILTLSLALPLWMAFMLFGWLNKTTHMLSHLVPTGTPGVLMPFMVCIESISNFIRPGTLAIRLAANMIAGHLLLTLMGNTGSSLNLVLLNIMLITQILLITLETAVSIIQAYVFTILTSLYSSEVN